MSLVLTCAVLAHPLVPGVAAAQRETRSLPRPAPMTGILDSLEHVALTATDASARARAALTITDAGRLQVNVGPTDTARRHPRYPGVVARLVTIYRKSADPVLRDLIVQWMPVLADRPHAIAFLAEVASETPIPRSGGASHVLPPGHGTASSRAHTAIYALTRMGAAGRAALARLDVSGSVRDPEARAYLARLANEGYEDRE
jgi:hypothetical protein